MITSPGSEMGNDVLQSQITDATFKEQISAMYIQANTTYIAGREKLTKKG